MTAPAITIQNVRKAFSLSFSLGPLTFEVPRGAICALVGPNGAGKTTLLNMLMGIGSPDDGRAVLLGHDIVRDGVEVRRRTALASPELDYRAWGTVGRAIDFVSGFYPDWNEERCERLQMNFGVHRGERIETLSFGARVKLAIVLALSRDAELLLLDEPTAGLDPLARQMLFKELLRFMQNEERSIVISSHQLSDLERFADHIAVLNEGQLITSGAVPALLERYVQLDVQLPGNFRLPRRPGLHEVARDGDRARLLVDRSQVEPAMLSTLGVEVIQESTLTLEELFIALMKGGGSLRRWQPQMAAA